MHTIVRIQIKVLNGESVSLRELPISHNAQIRPYAGEYILSIDGSRRFLVVSGEWTMLNEDRDDPRMGFRLTLEEVVLQHEAPKLLHSENAEKQEFVKTKYRPRLDEFYYTPCFEGEGFEVINTLYDDLKIDRIRKDKGWCFTTVQECQTFCDKLNQAISQVKP